jgi:hypothetical protein
MAFNNFKRLIDEEVSRQIISSFYHDNKEELLSYYDKEDPYFILLKILNNESEIITDYLKTRLPWRLIQLYYYNSIYGLSFYFGNQCLLTIHDLEEPRIINLSNGYLYFEIIIHFLLNHDVDDIPTSFINLYEQLINCDFRREIAYLIKCLTVESILDTVSSENKIC